MKNLKVVFAVVMVIMMITSCTSKQDVLAPKVEKQSEVATKKAEPTLIQITVAQLKSDYKFDFIQVWEEIQIKKYGSAGLTKGKKPTASTVINVWLNDLTWLQTGDVKQITISPNAQWVGIQNFQSTTSSDGATVPTGCNGFYWTPPGAGQSFTCNGNGPGYYRGFTSDFLVTDTITGDITYTVHVTEFNQQL